MCFRLEFIVGFAVISCHLTKTALGKSHKKPKYFMFAVTWLYGKYFRTSIKFKGYTN